MTITYSLTDPIAPDDVQRLFKQTRWAHNRSVDGIREMLGSSLTVGAWYDGALVGFARAITDDLYRAFIEDVVVDEALRGQGIGRGLMEHLLRRLEHVEEVILSCEDHLLPFYRQFGFRHVTHQFMNLWRGI